jgi:creatinine amidohydrolase/Fe(II)-dependent formamide hydrolase-like protein
MTRIFFALALCATLPVRAGVLRAAELNTEQFKALDKAHTAVIIPGGILEEHGPFLPSYTDGYVSERWAEDLAQAIGARPGWTALVLPAIPLGSNPANILGQKWTFPGSITVRPATLRSVYMDLGASLGDQGFSHIFLVNGHGAPEHNRVLDQAGDWFHEVYGGTMVHLLGLQPLYSCCEGSADALSKPQLAENGFSVHASLFEHSRLLFLKPGLVDPKVKDAPSITARDFSDALRIARAPEWPGYFGAPKLASAEIGQREIELVSAAIVQMALQILDGLDVRKIPRFGDAAAKEPSIKANDEAAAAHDRELEKREKDWVARKKLR